MKKIHPVLITGIVSFLLIELVMRIFNIPRLYKTHSFPAQFEKVANPDIGYVNKKSTSIDFVYPDNPRKYFAAGNIVFHTTNSYGFRGKEFAVEKKQGIKRIVFLGDSFIFGEGVHDKDTLAEQLGNKLPGYEMINLGVGGYNTWQEWVILRDVASRLEPDIVVVGYTLNDAEPYLFLQTENGLMRRNREAFVPESLPDPPPFANISKIGYLVWQIADISERNNTVEAYYRSLYNDSTYGWPKTKEAIARMGEFLSEKSPALLSCILSFTGLTGILSTILLLW